VKQVIGKSNLIPWSKVWSASSPSRTNAESTPMGGLMLHWIFSVVLIISSSAINSLGEAISFPGNLQAYASAFVGSKRNVYYKKWIYTS